MSGTVGWILFDNVAENLQDVVSCLVQLLIPFCKLHAFAACAVDNARFPVQSTISALFLEEVSQRSKYSVLPMLVINSFDLSLNGLNSLVLFKSCSNESRFG